MYTVVRQVFEELNNYSYNWYEIVEQFETMQEAIDAAEALNVYKLGCEYFFIARDAEELQKYVLGI